MTILTVFHPGGQAIANTIAALQNLHAGIDGIEAAPTALSGYYDTAYLPLAWSHPGPTPNYGGWRESAQLRQYDRNYYVDVFVMPEGQGVGLDDGYQLTLALLQRFGMAYLNDPNLSGAIAHFVSIQDTGATLLRRGDVKYHGFRFTLTVREKTA